MRLPTSLLIASLGLWALLAAGCSPAAKSAKLLQKADAHFTAGRYDEAEIEYKNVLQLEPLNPAAIGRLGNIYYDQTRVLAARSFLQKAVELQPANLEWQLKLGLTEVIFRDYAAARTKALMVLDRAPQMDEAPLLLVQSLVNPKDASDARQRLAQLPANILERAPAQIALGILDLRENKLDSAEAAFKRAATLDPKSAEAHASLGAMHLIRKNPTLAEPELKLAADLSPLRSSKRIQYAQFLIQKGDVVAGRRLLTDLAKSAPDYLPAWMALAQIESLDRKYDESLGLVKKVLSRDPYNPEALMLKGRLNLAKGEFTTAVTELEKSLQIFPTSPQFLYQLALAHVASGDIRKGIDMLTQALTHAPDYTEARVLLAGLQMRTGDQNAAIVNLKSVLQKQPSIIQAWLLLADAYRAQKNTADALGVYAQIEKLFPGNARTPLLKGMTLMQQRKLTEARQAFDESLKRDPDSQPAIEQLVNLDLAEKKFPSARQRVEALIAAKPQSAELHNLLAKVFAAQQDLPQAEVALQKSITLAPNAPDAYFMLVQLQLANKQQDKALANLDKVIAANPKDIRAILLSGMLRDQLKQYDQALAAYEKVLALDPKSGIALNNVANLYATHFKQLEKGFETAKKARELFPHDPSLADTLGWILVQKRQYAWALTLLQESAEKLPTSAEVQYHLGTAHYLLGEEELARVALERSLELNQVFAGTDLAKKQLSLLTLDPSKAGPAERKLLEKALEDQPDDPIALARLGALHERDAAPKKAIAAYEASLKASPNNVRVTLNLIRLYGAEKETARAIELAKSARKLAPDNASIALELGLLAYQNREFTWAHSLLQEASRKLPEHVGALRALGQAAYSLGLVSEATANLRQSLEIDQSSTEASEAKNLLDLIVQAEAPDQQAAAKIAQRLKASPQEVPVLMVAAKLSEQKNDLSGAIKLYEQALEIFPEFSPAAKRLAILYVATESDSKKALEVALKARKAAPVDAELAKALGILLYRQEDFTRALPVLKESAAKLSEDAEGAYYLGMTHYRLKSPALAKPALQHALELRLNAKLATEARKVLAEIK